MSLAQTLMTWVAQFPSTNARIVTSLLLTVATGVRVLASWTSPPWEWLIFLAAMMGLDVAQFGLKRFTQHKNGGAKPNAG